MVKVNNCVEDGIGTDDAFAPGLLYNLQHFDDQETVIITMRPVHQDMLIFEM